MEDGPPDLVMDLDFQVKDEMITDQGTGRDIKRPQSTEDKVEENAQPPDQAKVANGQEEEVLQGNGSGTCRGQPGPGGHPNTHPHHEDESAVEDVALEMPNVIRSEPL